MTSQTCDEAADEVRRLMLDAGLNVQVASNDQQGEITITPTRLATPGRISAVLGGATEHCGYFIVVLHDPLT